MGVFLEAHSMFIISATLRKLCSYIQASMDDLVTSSCLIDVRSMVEKTPKLNHALVISDHRMAFIWINYDS